MAPLHSPGSVLVPKQMFGAQPAPLAPAGEHAFGGFAQDGVRVPVYLELSELAIQAIPEARLVTGHQAYFVQAPHQHAYLRALAHKGVP